MLFAALALFFIVVVLIVIQVLTRRSRLRAAPPESPRPELDGQPPEIYQVFGPLLKLLAGFFQQVPLPGVRERYEYQIERVGLQFDMTADEFLAIKLVVLLVATVFALLVYAIVLRNWLLVLALIFGGFFLPDIRLSDVIRKQRQAYLRALPAFLDLLALSVEAGLGFDAAIRKLTEMLDPDPLIRGFQMFLRSMSVGKSRTEALREMARKLDLPDFTSFSHAVTQAMESGSSLGPVLRIQSNEMTFRRFERAEKRAQQLPVRMLFPLFAFIFPATFLMIIGPLYFQIKASGVTGAF